MGAALRSTLEIKRRTRAAKDGLELSLRLPDASRTWDDYRRFLRSYHRFISSHEAMLAPFPWASIGIDFSKRRRTPLLEEDLRYLSIPPSAPSATPHLWEPETFDHAIGMLYASESLSALGTVAAPVIIERLGPSAIFCVRFLMGYQFETRAMWRQLRRAIDLRVETQHGNIDDMVAGALNTYGSFERLLYLNGVAS